MVKFLNNLGLIVYYKDVYNVWVFIIVKEFKEVEVLMNLLSDVLLLILESKFSLLKSNKFIYETRDIDCLSGKLKKM